jgi:hypothetical protein
MVAVDAIHSVFPELPCHVGYCLAKGNQSRPMIWDDSGTPSGAPPRVQQVTRFRGEYVIEPVRGVVTAPTAFSSVAGSGGPSGVR